jgi:hypothetical protein
MKGDFSRSTFDPQKHYKGVRMQQGRVQLDADWNEDLDILLHRIETETMDVIGLCGFPLYAAGFEVVADPSLLTSEARELLSEEGIIPLANGDFLLTTGRGYVDGIMCEIDVTIPYTQQPHVLSPPGFPSDGSFAIYLDVWERLITALEDPAIREVALGGPDTTVRSQVIWQVKFLKAEDVFTGMGRTAINLDCDIEINGWPPQASDGTLCARTRPKKELDDPCSVAPGAGYKRLENQLYRVEIHNSSDDPLGPTFKWSRDNGSVVVKVEEFGVDGAADKLRVSSLGRDDVLGLHELDWLEVLDEAHELSSEPGQLVQIDKIDRERLILTMKQNVTGFDTNLKPKLRRWDSRGGLKVEIAADNDGYIPLEAGVEVMFNSGTYHSGDYWLIPARTVPGQYGDIEWPKEGTEPACLEPFGITHHYCKLALVVVEGGIITEVADCREKFRPLTDRENCCSVTVGEGGDFTSIQEAVDARPREANSWNVCLLPGEHKLQESVIIANQENFTLSACNNQTLVTGTPGKPLFAALEVGRLRLEGLMFKADTSLGAILLVNCNTITICNCRGENRAREVMDKPTLLMLGCRDVKINGNQFVGAPSIVAQGQAFEIFDNHFTGGGIQFLFGSAIVRINHNRIIDGNGPGIQLGGILDPAEVIAFYREFATRELGDIENINYSEATSVPRIEYISISNNLIGSMDGSGILTMKQALDIKQLGEVSHLEIEHNQILLCAQNPDLQLSDSNAVGGGITLFSVLKVTIHGNLIANNGNGDRDGDGKAACGIIVTNAADVEIADNIVIGNGSEADQGSLNYQAGIAALFVFGNISIDKELGRNSNSNPLGMPALRVHGNKVVAPAGLAFTAVVAGTTQVTDNTFVTQGRLEQTPLFEGLDEIGLCVQVLNYGYQGWLEGLVGGLGGGVHFEIGIGALLQSTAKAFPDGRLMFDHNQVTLIFPEPKAEYNPKFPTASVLLFSLDDISLQGNQLQADSTPDLMFANTVALGANIRATSNNFSEPAGSTTFSYYSWATLMNITSTNTAVHCISTRAPQSIEQDNLVLSC